MPPAFQPHPEYITLEQYEALPETRRAEFFENIVYDMASPADDYIRKLYYYKNYGVREYWIVDPRRTAITINYFEDNIVSVPYSFDSVIKVNIFEDLFINFSEIANIRNI